MKLTPLDISDVIVIEPEVFKDDRGFFFEAYNQEKFNKALGKEINFAQDNQSFSKKGVLRGLHFQKPPFEQAKLIRVLRGKIFDVCVDLRIKSKTFGNWFGLEIDDIERKQLYIPSGFAHGFIVLSAEAEIIYKVNKPYNKESEVILKYDDPKLGINWPMQPLEISMKDMNAESFEKVYKFDC